MNKTPWTEERRQKHREMMKRLHAEGRIKGLTHADRVKGGSKSRKNYPNPKQREFVKKVVELGSPAKAYQAVYDPNASAKAASAGGSQLMRLQNVRALVQKADQRIIEEVAKSVDKVVEIREFGEDQKAQLMAAKTILDAYADTMRRIEKRDEVQSTTNNILITGMTDEQLVQRIAELGAQGAVPGAIEAQVQAGPAAAHAGSAGIREPGTDALGAGGEPAEG